MTKNGFAKPLTRELLDDRNKRLKKLGEEPRSWWPRVPTGIGEGGRRAADLFYHTLVALRSLGVGLDDVRETLASRAASQPNGR